MNRLVRLLFVMLGPLLLSACVVPAVYGPHYRPVYPDAEHIGKLTLSNTLGPLTSPLQSPAAIEQKVQQGTRPAKGDAWIIGAAGTRLRFKFDECYMQAYAKDEGGDFILDWSVNNDFRCNHQLSIDNVPLVFEDVETGKKYNVRVFQRLFQSSQPGLGIDKSVDLAAMLPGYREVPAEERQYTVSLDLRSGFNGKLPEQLTIKFPAIWVGTHKVQLPPLVMRPHKKLMSRFSDYTPDAVQIVPNYGAIDQVWFEQAGELSVSSYLSGWEDGKKWGDYYSSGFLGGIHIQVLSGLPIRFEQPYLIWQEDAATPRQMPLKRFNLVKYTTTRFDDSLSSEFLGWDPASVNWKYGDSRPESRPIEPFDDKGVNAVVQIHDFKPERVRVTLPRILVDGVVWPVQPIEFDYQSGSVEIIDAM